MATTQKQVLDRIIGSHGPDLRRAGMFSVIASCLWLPQAALVAWVFAALVEGRGALWMVLTAAGGFAGISVVRALLDYVSESRLEALAGQVVSQEQSRIIDQEQRVSPYAAAALSSARIAALVTDKLPVLLPFLTRYRPVMARVSVVPLLILALAFSMSWSVGLTLLIAGPLIPVFMALVGMAAQETSERQMEEIASMNELLLERLGALLDTRLLSADEFVVREFEGRADRVRRQTMAVLRVAFLSSTVLELFAALGVALVAVYVGFALLGELSFGAYSTPLTIFEGVFLLLLAPDFFQPLRDMAAAWHDRASANAVAVEIADLERDAGEMVLGNGGDPRSIGSVSLQWSPLHFIGPPEFTLPAGEIFAGEAVAITGASGVGKSTLLSVLGGLLRPAEGTVHMGDIQLGPDSIESLRGQMAWIPQLPYFFAGSLQANLTMGREGALSLAAALALAGAQEVVARLPAGLDSELAENGAGVSGGEARRLMIARAAYTGAKLIFADEPTADLDDETAALVVAALLELRARGATIVAASHDPRLVCAFDREISL